MFGPVGTAPCHPCSPIWCQLAHIYSRERNVHDLAEPDKLAIFRGIAVRLRPEISDEISGEPDMASRSLRHAGGTKRSLLHLPRPQRAHALSPGADLGKGLSDEGGAGGHSLPA